MTPSLYREGTGPGLPYPTDTYPRGRGMKARAAKPQLGRGGRLVLAFVIILAAMGGVFVALSHVNTTPPAPSPITDTIDGNGVTTAHYVDKDGHQCSVTRGPNGSIKQSCN